MIKTHKLYIDYVITIILASDFYVTNTSISTLFTSIISASDFYITNTAVVGARQLVWGWKP
jgi:hypothetical protein